MTQQPPLKVAVLGLRGFPNIQGGVEKHAEQLYPRLASLGCQVCVIGRSPYKSPAHGNEWNNVDFEWLWAPEIRGVESMLHSLLAVVAAARRRPDIVHIHAIGPSIVAPLARLLGMKVVVTHHGKDYERQKWGPVARSILRLGERLGMRSAHERIVISEIIRRSVYGEYGLNSVVIPNGIERPAAHAGTTVHSKFGLEPNKYVLQVSRLVPEKRQLDLIEAFRAARLPEPWKLAIVGDTEFPDAYSKSVHEMADSHPDIVCTGFQVGDHLRDLYARAGMFVLPSSHEGLPIALLEALSHSIPVIASDIPPNVAIGLDRSCYFKLGDVASLSSKLKAIAAAPPSREQLDEVRELICARYDWDSIARATLAVYERATS